MSTDRTLGDDTLEIELLGQRVRIDCAEPRFAERLAITYAVSLVEVNRDRPAIEAALGRQGGTYRVTVEGRDPLILGEDGAVSEIEAMRALHHELLHAVMLARPELFYLHAAVCAFGGMGVVFPGLSMAGKSTLVLACLERGAAFLSDELLAFDPGSSRALAFPRAPKVRDVCVDYFPDLAGRFVGTGEGRFLPIDALPGPGPTDAAYVRAIVLPRWSREGNRLEAIGPGAALLELAGSVLNFGTHRSQSVDHLERLVRGTRACKLTWTEPHAAVELLLGELALGGRP